MKTQEYKTFYLEAKQKPEIIEILLPKDTEIKKFESGDINFYKYLFISIGKKWKWVSRLQMDDKKLEEVISSSKTEIYVLYHKGAPAGYAELDCSDEKNIELVFLGLIEKYIGKGIGKVLMQTALKNAWCKNPERVWLHTCELDSEAALNFYMKFGFNIYKEEKENVTLPEDFELDEFYSLNIK